MHKTLVALVGISVAASPAAAQVAPVATVQPQTPAATPAPKTIKKTVCERIRVEESTGSRLGSSKRTCRTIEVPAAPASPGGSNSDRAPYERG